MAPAVLNRLVDDETIRYFCEDFKSSVAREEKKRNNEIKMLIQLGKLKATHVDEYKDEHPIKLDRVYADMYVDKETYPSMMKLLIFYSHAIMHKARESTKSKKHRSSHENNLIRAREN